MGNKMPYDPDDPFFDIVKPRPKGICGGCYCCGQQIHLEFQYLEILPTARIDGLPYQVLICDMCEEDISNLEGDGFKNVSYDVLSQIQEELRERMLEHDDLNGDISEKDRFEILKELYLEFEFRFNKLKG